MRTLTLRCPRCGRSITVTAAAPPVLTCPTCLARIENSGVPAELPPPLPVPVIPLETEVRWDTISARVAAAALGLILLTGLLMVTGTVRRGAWNAPLLVVLVAAALGGTVVTAAQRPRSGSPHRSAGPAAGMQFTIGLLGGVAGMAALLFTGQFVGAVYAVPLAAIVLALIPWTRAIGAGLLVSIGVSVLILVGLCFAALAHI